MTTLRSFQDEIDGIHQQEIAKQRANAFAERESAKKAAKTKEPPDIKGKERPMIEPSMVSNFDDEAELQVCLTSSIILIIHSKY